MDTLENNIKKIIAYFQEHKLPIANLIELGLERSIILQLTKNLPFKLPEEVIQFYEVLNGLKKVKGNYPFFPNGYLISLNEAIGQYAFMKDMTEKIATEDNISVSDIWDSTIFPIFRTVTADYYGIKCSVDPTHTGPICYVFNEDCSANYAEFDSLSSMINTIAYKYEKGIYYIGEDGLIYEH